MPLRGKLLMRMPLLVLLPLAASAAQQPSDSARATACAAHEQPAAPEQARPTERDGYVPTPDGLSLYYCLLGDGPDTIIALHGGAGLDMGYMIPGLLPLAREHEVLLYDQRGAGHSSVVKDSTAINLSAHIADLEALRRSFGFKRMILLGHSWGAMLAARFAARYPNEVNRLILVDAGPPRRSPYLQQFLTNATGWMDSVTRVRFETLSAALDTATQPIPVCRASRELWLPDLLATRADTLLLAQLVNGGCTAPIEALHNRNFAGRLTMRSLGDWDWRGDFREVLAPVLIVQGDRDPIPMASADEWRDAFRDARLLVLQEAGHYSYADRPDVFVRAVGDFLK